MINIDTIFYKFKNAIYLEDYGRLKKKLFDYLCNALLQTNSENNKETTSSSHAYRLIDSNKNCIA